MGKYSLLTTLTLNASGFNRNISSATKSTQNFKRGTEQASSAITSSFRNMSGVLGGAVNSQIGMLGQTLQSGIGAFRAMVPAINGVKMALISSGIGAIVVAIGVAFAALSSYLTGTQEGADKLNIIMGYLKGTFNAIIQRVNLLGSALIKLFSGDFKGMKDDFAEAFKGGLFDEIKESATQYAGFANEANKLKREKLQLDRDSAKLEAEMAAYQTDASNKLSSAVERQKAQNEFKKRDAILDERKQTYLYNDWQLQLKINASKGKSKSYSDEELANQKEIAYYAELKKDAEEQKTVNRIDFQIQTKIGNKEVSVDDLENRIKEGIYKGENVMKLVAELEIKKKKDAEVESIYNQLTNQVSITLPEDSTDKLFNDLNADILNMDIEPIKLELAPIPTDTLNGVASQVQTLAGTLSGFFDTESAEYKAFAIVQALIGTYLAAVQVMANQAKLGPVAMGIAFAGTIASGLAAVAKIQGFASGGIVDGNSFSGDKVLARVNSGEMILNQAQQSRLFDIANNGGYGRDVRFEIEGTKLVGVLEKYNKRLNGIR